MYGATPNLYTNTSTKTDNIGTMHFITSEPTVVDPVEGSRVSEGVCTDCRTTSPGDTIMRDRMISMSGLFNKETDDGDEFNAHLESTPWDNITSKYTNNVMQSSDTITTISGSAEDNSNSLSVIESIRVEGTLILRKNIISILMKYGRIFSNELRRSPAKIPPMELKVNVQLWRNPKHRAPPRVVSDVRTAAIISMTAKMLADDLIETSDASEHSQVLLTPKPDSTFRFCIDYRLLNSCTDNIDWPLPNIEQLIRRLGSKKSILFAKFDFTHGYHQAGLALNSRIFTTFTTSVGKFQWKRVPMGLKGAPSYFQKVMASEVLKELTHNVCELYIDDLLVYGTSEEGFFTNLELVLRRLDAHDIVIKPSKCVVGTHEVE